MISMKAWFEWASKASSNRPQWNTSYRFRPGVLSSVIPESQLLPLPRSGHKIVCNEFYFLSYGGYNPDGDQGEIGQRDAQPFFHEVWRFDFASKRWSLLDVRGIPQVLVSNSAILCGKMFMVYGGTGMPIGGLCSNTLYICDLSDENNLQFVAVEATGDMPTPLYGQGIIVQDHYLYTVGGTTGNIYFSDIYRLNMKTKVWTAVYVSNGSSRDPKGRYRHELAFYQNKIIMLGGGTADTVCDFINLPAFDLRRRCWTYIETHPDLKTRRYPKARRLHSAVQLESEDKVVVLGGYGGLHTADDSWYLDLKSMRWTLVKRMKYPYYFHASAITPSGKVYCFGGVHSLPDTFSAEHRSRNIYCGYATIPKLSEMSWEALLFARRVQNKSFDQLIEMGVPKRFASRLHLQGF